MAADDKILLRRYHEDGDLAAREELIERYMSLVCSLARRYAYRGEQLDDLVQIGAIGLIKAIDRFDLERGVELTTYATPNIIGEIKRHFRDKAGPRVLRGLQELNVQVTKLIEQLTVQLGRSPTIPSCEGGWRRGGAGARGARERTRTARCRSRPAAASTRTVSRPARVARDDRARGRGLEDRAVLAPGFKVLDERERKILHLRFFSGSRSRRSLQRSASRRCTSPADQAIIRKIREEIAEESEVA